MMLRGVVAALLTLLAARADASPHRARHRRHRSTRTAPAPTHPPRAVTVRPPRATPARPALGTPSAGCAARDTAPLRGVGEQTLTVNGTERSYLLSVPDGYDAQRAPMPLVFAFHGLTGTPASLRGYMHLEREAAGAAIFVYPAGLRTDGAHGRSTTHWDTHGDGVDVAFFDALLARLAETYCVDMGRVFAVGHSAGAVITNEMGCHRGNVLRAIAPVAGSGPWSRQCTEAPSVWITHGRADAPVAFHYGESSRDHWLAAAHCAPEGVADDDACVRYGCEGDARVVFCAHEGDHSPPPFAARAIWRFFSGL